MIVAYISTAVLLSTLIRPVNRWVMSQGVRAPAYGFWICLRELHVA